MIELVSVAAAEAPDHPAVITAEETLTYGQLLQGARHVAAELRRRDVTRFAVVEPDAALVLTLLAGAALAGAEPCQYQADADGAELVEQAADAGHTVVVTRRADIAGRLQVLHPHELRAGGTADAAVGAADAAVGGPQPLLVRTTGTTGRPKAARHDWRVLARTVSGTRPRPEQRWLLAYGPHQFAGVQVLLHVVAARATLVAPFPRQPRDGLRALLHDGVTCISATPTYWRFLLAEARGSGVVLPALEQVTLGGEAVPGDLLDELRTAFPGARISQVYASTELGSITSVTDGRPGLASSSLWSPANPEAAVRVEGGQLWARARAGMLGYAGGTGPSAAVRGSVAAGAGGDGPEDEAWDGDRADGAHSDLTADGWLPTGDLVEVVGDRVLFRGRTSEVINVGGVKVHPLPVERRIAAVPGVALARVFGRPNPLTGAIVAAEVVPARLAGGGEPNVEELRRAVKEAVADLPPAWRPRSVGFVDAIETRGGKTVRGVRA